VVEWQECEACGGIGYQRYDVTPGHPLFGKMVPCEKCGEARRATWLQGICRLSPEMRAYNLDDFKDRNGKLKDMVPFLRKALAIGHGWVTLSGPPGTGKTFLLAAMANEAIAAGRMAVYTTTADLLADLRDSFHPEAGKGYSSLLTDVMGASVLCLDEIEKFKATEWAEETFFRLVEDRYRFWNTHLTILATNRQIGLDKAVITDTRFPGYLESRIMDGRFWQLDHFWDVSDARPALRRPHV